MATKIVTKNSSTANAVPAASDLVQGELAVNVADKRLFTEDNGGSIVELGTNPSTLTVTGEITANGGIALGDNDKATFGASDDLQIYHDGNSWIKDTGSGNLVLDTNGNGMFFKHGDETLFEAYADGAVNLRHNNVQKLATTSTGIDVTGTATMEGLFSGPAATSGLNYGYISSLPTSNSAGFIGWTPASVSGFSNGDLTYIPRTSTEASHLFYTGNGTPTKSLRIAGNGNISFYEDTGTTPKLFWDASAESLGIGTSSPSGLAHIYSSSSGATAGAGGDELILESSATTGLSILSGTSNDGNILFGDSGNSAIGYVQYKHANNALAFGSNSAERLRIDSSGNVGIGTSSPSYALDVNSGTMDDTVRFKSTDDTVTIVLEDNDTVNEIESSAVGIRFDLSGSEKMRIDASGSLLVGKTTSSIAVAGTVIEAIGRTWSSVDGGYVAGFNRLTSDGEILNFRKNGTSVGSIGSEGGDTLYIGTSDTGLRFHSADRIVPHNPATNTARDAAIDLGRASERFKDLYLSGGVYLGGTGAANKLDDYEEGTWTPSFNYGTGITYTTQAGTYTKIGSLVTATFTITVSALGSDTDEVHITLPFSSTGNFCVYTCSAYASTLVHGGGYGSPTSGRTANVARLSGSHIVISENDGERLSYADLQSSGIISGAVTYRTTA